MAKKHKKWKPVDPEYILKERFELPQRSKSRYNCTPLDLEKQEVPRKMQDLIDLKNNGLKNKTGKKNKKKSQNYLVVHKAFMGKDMPGMSKPLPRVPEVMAQRDNESVSHFLGRIQDLANKYHTEAKMEAKFGIGEPEFDLGKGKDERGSKKKEKGKLFKKKQKEKKMRKSEDGKDFSELKDSIPFGETVMAPPVLTTPKKAKQIQQKPGMKNLLLKSSYQRNKKEKPSSVKRRVVICTKQELETERKKAVELYRAMKTRKHVNLPVGNL